MVFGDARWVKPTTVADLQTAISGAAGKKIRIMGANTGTGKNTSSDINISLLTPFIYYFVWSAHTMTLFQVFLPLKTRTLYKIPN